MSRVEKKIKNTKSEDSKDSVESNCSLNPDHKLPLKSIDNRRCLTQCYPANESYFHPTILQVITEPHKNSCAIDPFYDVKQEEMIYTDKCIVENNLTHELPTELNVILLNFDFHYRDFLSNMYNLNSFDQVIYWTLENSYLPFDTIKRVHNCAWKAYGNKMSNLSEKVLEYYYDVVKINWIKDYYKSLSKKFIFHISNDNKLKIIRVGDKSTESNAQSHTAGSRELYELIIFYYFNYSFFIKVIKSYLKVYKNTWEDIPSHYGNLKNFCYKHLFKNIKKSI